MKPLKRYVKVLLFIFLSVNNASTQQIGAGPWVKIKFKLNQIELVNKELYNQIDSLILKSDCNNLTNNANKYFFISFHTKNVTHNLPTCNNCFFMFFELLDSPRKSTNISGFFVIQDYYFFVRDYMPENFMKKIDKEKEFVTNIKKLPATQSHPYWIFLFNNNKIEDLLELDCW